MKNKDHYPQDYGRAFHNTFSDEEVDELLKGTRPLFVFDHLKLPKVLKSIAEIPADFDVAAHMTQATLWGYQLWIHKNTKLPVVTPSRELGRSVNGFLVFGLTPSQHWKICQYYKLSDNSRDITEFEVCMIDGNLRYIDAGIFLWTGSMDELKEKTSRSWKIDKFLNGAWYKGVLRQWQHSPLSFPLRADQHPSPKTDSKPFSRIRLVIISFGLLLLCIFFLPPEDHSIPPQEP